MTCLERDTKTMNNILTAYKEIGEISKAVKKTSNYQRYNFLRDHYPEFAKEIDAMKKEQKTRRVQLSYDKTKDLILEAIKDGKSFQYIIKTFCGVKVLKAWRKEHPDFDAQIKKLFEEQTDGYDYDALYKYVLHEVQNGATVFGLLRSKKISQVRYYRLSEKQRNKIKTYTMHRSRVKAPDPEDKACEWCGNLMKYSEYELRAKENVRRAKFKQKKYCCENCTNSAREYNIKKTCKNNSTLLDAPITFYDYIMDELCHMYSDRNEPQHRYLEILAEEICLPLEQLERIIDGQEQLTVKIAERLRVAGVCFSLDSMFKIAAKAQRR